MISVHLLCQGDKKIDLGPLNLCPLLQVAAPAFSTRGGGPPLEARPSGTESGFAAPKE